MKVTCGCMILAREGQGRLIQCLESALKSGCFEEIIILLDSRAKPGIRNLIGAYLRNYPQIKVYEYVWSKPADFADARNHAIEVMTAQYGFWLDGDEVLLEPEGIRQILENPKGCAYNMTVVSLLPDGSRFDMYQPRLFPVKPGVFFECAVFERLDWALQRAGVCIVDTVLTPIWHTGYLCQTTNRDKMYRNISAAHGWLSVNNQASPQWYHVRVQYSKMTGE